MLRLLAVLAAAVPLLGQAAPKAEILEYGYYEFQGESQRMEHPLTASGHVTQGRAKLVEQTQRIPIKKGRLFGFRFHIGNIREGVNIIPLELVVKHPPMKKPDGTVSTGYRYPMDLKLDKGEVTDNSGYRLSETFEMVEGDWSFEFLYMNEPLLKQEFTTYKP